MPYRQHNSPFKVRKTKKGLALKRWFKEEWKDEKGNVCGSKKKVGMGKRRASSSNVS